MNRDQFFSLAQSQGQTRMRTETRNEFEKRVTDLKAKRDKSPDPWRRDNKK